MNNVVPINASIDAPLNAAARSARIDELFALLEAAIRISNYQQSDVFQVIADWSANGDRIVGHAMAEHAAAILRSIECQDAATIEWTCTDVIVEMYRRTFFHEETARRFGTHFLIEDLSLMERFVADMISNTPAPKKG